MERTTLKLYLDLVAAFSSFPFEIISRQFRSSFSKLISLILLYLFRDIFKYILDKLVIYKKVVQFISIL